MKTAGSKSLEPWQVSELEALAAMEEAEIDTTDVAEVTDWSRARRGISAEPQEASATLVRLDARVFAWFTLRDGPGEAREMRINRVLRDYVEAQEQKAG